MNKPLPAILHELEITLAKLEIHILHHRLELNVAKARRVPLERRQTVVEANSAALIRLFARDKNIPACKDAVDYAEALVDRYVVEN
jgi:hypothetical protein